MRFSRNPAAQADIWNQWNWYIDQGLPHIADKFFTAIEDSFEAITKSPFAGSPRCYRNPRLEGMRVWRIKGFEEMRVYYLATKNDIVIVRVLHDKRDVTAILEEQK